MALPTLRLKQDIHKHLRGGNPWIFADAIEPPSDLQTGDIVQIDDSHGEFLGRGVYERESPIAVRMWTLKKENVDDHLLTSRIASAELARRRWLADDTTGFRLLNGEGDRTPGIVCDIYGTCAVFRIDGRAAERWLDPAIETLKSMRTIKHVVVRRSEKYRDNHAKAEWIGEPRDGPVPFTEHGVKFVCDPINGQKTGFFLDQRANRQHVATWATGRRLLNLFGYTGGFSVVAAAAGATHTTTVDLAKPAIEMAKENFLQNDLAIKDHEFVASDVYKFLDNLHPRSAPFDVVVCDPPSFAHRKKDVGKAKKSYQRLFAQTLSVMPKQSTVCLASCSSQINRGDFLKIVAASAREASVDYILHGVFGADVDHPWPVGFPEANYLQFCIGTIG